MDLLATTRAARPGAQLVLAFHGQWEDETAWPERLGERGRELTWVFPRGPFRDEAERRGRRLSGYSWYEYTGDRAAFAAARETAPPPQRASPASTSAARHSLSTGVGGVGRR